MLNVMFESPVADGRGGVASAFSSSSESSITLTFAMSKYAHCAGCQIFLRCPKVSESELVKM